MSEAAFEGFIASCEFLARTYGRRHDWEEALAKCSGVIPKEDKTVTYVDKVICIVRSTTSKAMLIEKLENGHPVVCRDAEGNIFRHGELWDLDRHVRELINGGVG